MKTSKDSIIGHSMEMLNLLNLIQKASELQVSGLTMVIIIEIGCDIQLLSLVIGFFFPIFLIMDFYESSTHDRLFPNLFCRLYSDKE